MTDTRRRVASQLDAESSKIKAKYSSALSTLQELFPDWKEEDLLAVLGETNGNLEESVARIAEGMCQNIYIYIFIHVYDMYGLFVISVEQTDVGFWRSSSVDECKEGLVILTIRSCIAMGSSEEEDP